MDPQSQDPSYLQRLFAAKLVRENMFFAKPEQYGMLDFADDLPGAAKPVGHLLSNVLPSAAIISQDPDARKQQIEAAINRIKSSHRSKEDLHKEMMTSALDMAKGSIIPSVGLALLPKLLGLRAPWGKVRAGALGMAKSPGLAREGMSAAEYATAAAANLAAGNQATAATLKTSLRSPFSLNRIRRAFDFKSKGSFMQGGAHTGKDVLSNAAMGVGLGAASGAAYPYLGDKLEINDKALESARKVLEEQPYMTSLPTSEMLSVLQDNSGGQPDRLQSAALGTVLGGATGAISGVMPAAFTALGVLLTGGKWKPKGGLLGAKALTALKQSVKGNAGLGALAGGAGGYLTNTVVPKEHMYRKDLQDGPQSNTPAAAVSTYQG